MYAGGDFAGQQDATVTAFRAAFPDIELNMIVDYGKYHDVRIDRQIETGTLVADVTHLQTSPAGAASHPTRLRPGRLAGPHRPYGPASRATN
ncbi:hypothetical protein [Streptomyces longispororuber]|uniref:hypothetical protein n=1 Tax=Streptomyces longispororuber TaxID=68230 RepID=UPI0027E31D37|nr:hypothetical protein [Streptomyces longispororuber]